MQFVLLAIASLPIFRLRADPGILDTAFDFGATLGTAGNAAAFGVSSIALQTNGMMIVGGYFNGFYGDNAARNFLARLATNGSLDVSFDAKLGANNGPQGFVSSVVIQPDEKIVMGGGFNNINGVKCNRFARLNDDGSLDTTFNTDPGADGAVNVLVRQKDGKLLLGGAFASVNGVARGRFARLNGDGSVDTVFNPGAGANNTVWTMALQTDNRVVVGGIFTNINGRVCNRIARLNSDGSLDTSFSPPSGVDDGIGPVRRVNSIVVQPDGKLIVGGWFSSLNGQPCTGIARLNADGTTDAIFDVTCLHQSGSGADLGYVNAIALQPDGKILVCGNFYQSDGATNDGICRLNPDGSLDANFKPGSNGSIITAVAIQPDGKLVLGGEFISFAGAARYHLARLDGDPVLRATLVGNQCVLTWPTSYTNFTVECATRLIAPLDWVATSNPTVISGGQFAVTNAIDGASSFYRLKR